MSMTPLRTGILVIACVLATWFVFDFFNTKNTNEREKGENTKTECPTDAKVCPDGSSVGRTGSKCEFAACPNTPAKTPTATPKEATPSTPTSPAISGTVVARYSERVSVGGVAITPVEVVEDNRCPSDAQCVWQGTIKVRTRIQIGTILTEKFMEIGKPVVVDTKTITLSAVIPAPKIGQPIGSNLYRFTFEVK